MDEKLGPDKATQQSFNWFDVPTIRDKGKGKEKVVLKTTKVERDEMHQNHGTTGPATEESWEYLK